MRTTFDDTGNASLDQIPPGPYAQTQSGVDILTEAPPPVVLLSGISGSGKTVALAALEDAGYFCCDNLPPELLEAFITLERGFKTPRIAVAADVRTEQSLPMLLPTIQRLRLSGTPVLPIFLDAGTETLVRRFSETRRRHPLSSIDTDGQSIREALVDAIEHERTLLTDLRNASTVIDTSDLRPAQLRTWLRQIAGAAQASILTVVFESFAFKNGVPRDADLVFDLRVLPNPHYVRELRPLTGRDPGVIEFLRTQPEVGEILAQIEAFLLRWLPNYQHDQRSYLTVAVGCTGGQHRSVYCAEALTRRFRDRVPTLVRHRELEAREH